MSFPSFEIHPGRKVMTTKVSQVLRTRGSKHYEILTLIHQVFEDYTHLTHSTLIKMLAMWIRKKECVYKMHSNPSTQ